MSVSHTQRSHTPDGSPQTCGEANVIETVEQRQPGWLQGIFASGMVQLPKFPGERGHSLGRGECLIIKPIICRGQRDQHASEGQRPIEVMQRRGFCHID